MIEMQVTKEMWEEWKRNPVTNAFMREVAFRRENVKEQMAQNRFETNWQQAVGAAMALADVLNIEFQGETDDSNTGVQASS